MPTSWAMNCPESLPDRAGKRAKIPAASSPQIPPTAWAEIEPPGSSTFNPNSNHSTAYVTRRPATAPRTTASAGLINMQPALLATKPPIHPLHVSEASGLPKRKPVTAKAANPAHAAANVVLTATSKVCPEAAPPNKIAPAEFRPSQPTQHNIAPNITNTPLCAGIA